MMAAGTAAARGAQVLLIEKNKILGRKLLITGKGRCNVTNFCDVDNVIKNITSSNPKFMYSALHEFGCYDTYDFFVENGVPLKTERGNRVFPESDRASDIRDALKNYIMKNGVKIIHETVISVSAEPLTVKTDKSVYQTDSVIIATGGLSYPATGSTGDGLRFAAEMSHKIVKPQPALVPLIGSAEICKALAGLSLKNVEVKIYDGNSKCVFEQFGEMLFTHTGVSGPVILTASSVIDFSDKTGYVLCIDLKPALTSGELEKRIIKDFNKNINRDFINSLDELLPKSLIPAIVRMSGIPERQKVNSITKNQRSKLIETIKAFRLDIYDKAGFDEAIITSGGVDTLCIDPKTMESKSVKGIYFAGEVIDVSANTGGYNLQIAFSSGYLAGKCCAGG